MLVPFVIVIVLGHARVNTLIASETLSYPLLA
jgi:hypothetical protein